MSEFLFFLRKAVSAFAYPPTFCVLLALIGLVLSWTSRFRRSGSVLALASLALLFLLSIPAVQAPFLRWAEAAPDSLEEVSAEIDAIVVLGAGVLDVPADRPATRRLGATGLARAAEGIRLAKKFPEPPLVFTGGMIGDRPASSAAMADFAAEMGIGVQRTMAFDAPRSTAEEAAETAGFLGEGARVILVSSATHLPRAKRLFEAEGLEVLLAPADYEGDDGPLRVMDFLPSASTWENWQRLFHEWYGRVWARVSDG